MHKEEERLELVASQGSFCRGGYRERIHSYSSWISLLIALFLVTCLLLSRQLSTKHLRRLTQETNLLCVYSTAFLSGGHIPKRYGCCATLSVPSSIPLSWNFSGNALSSKTFVLLMRDPDAVNVTGLDFIHWFIINISPTSDMIIEIPENASRNVQLLPQGCMEMMNSAQSYGYFPPCPPDRDHQYYFKIYILDSLLNPKDWQGIENASVIVERLSRKEQKSISGIYKRACDATND